MEIKVISFDVDDTLVDESYNDLIWHRALPEMVAKKKNINYQDAINLVQNGYDLIGEKDTRWYDIRYWIKYFQLGLNYNDLLEKYEEEIVIFPDVISALERLSQKYRLICITAMPREFLDIKLKKMKQYFGCTFSTLSDYGQLKNKKIYSQINYFLEIKPQEILHIGDHEQFDYIAARDAGWNSLLIDRYGLGFQEKYPNSTIHNLTDVLNLDILNKV